MSKFALTKPKFIYLLPLIIGVAFSSLAIVPASFPDTPGYISDEGSLNGYFSLTGNSIRAWPTVLVFWLAKTDQSRVFIQAVLFGISWILLMIACSLNKTRMISLSVIGLFTVLALTPRFIQWNQFLLSESVSVSLVISALGTMHFALKEISERRYEINHKWFLISTLLFSFAAINRASLLPMTLIPIFLLPCLLKKQYKFKFTKLSMVLITIFSLIYPIHYNNATNKYWGGDGTNLTRSSFYFIYNTSDGNLQPVWGDALWQDITKKAPQCLSRFRGSGIDSGRNPYYQASVMVTLCPEGIAWLNENYDKEYLKFILINPLAAIKYEISMIKYVMDPTPYPVDTILPIGLSRIFESFHYQGVSYRPHLLWFSAALIAMFMLLILRIKPNYSAILAILAFVLGLSSITLTQFFIVSEPVRITTPATLITLVGAVLVILEVLQLLINRVSINRSRIPEVINNN